MAFRFSLESILSFRKSVEQAEELTLHKIVQEIVSVQLELQRTEADHQSVRAQRDRDLAKGLPAIHLQELAEKEQQLANNSIALSARLRDLETQRVKQLAVLRVAQQNREVLSEMRKHKHDAYQLAQRRQEQKNLDDLFLSRMHDDD